MPPQTWLSLQTLYWMQDNPQEGFSQWLQHHVREYVDDAKVRCCPCAAWTTFKSQSVSSSTTVCRSMLTGLPFGLTMWNSSTALMRKAKASG